jgi:hypothetical protein
MARYGNIEFNGVERTLIEWSRHLGLNYNTLYNRYVRHMEYPNYYPLEYVFKRGDKKKTARPDSNNIAEQLKAIKTSLRRIELSLKKR